MNVEQLKDNTTMKKIFTLLMMAVSVMMLTGCNWSNESDRQDRREAGVLEGSWTGYIDTYFYDRFSKRGNSYRTTMYFERIDSYGGVGYEVDYNMNSPYEDYYYCEFEWDVERGVIYINYADSWNEVAIYDYRLDANRFWGYMDDGTSRDISFELLYTSSFDWAFYRSRYVRTRSGDAPRYHAAGEFAKAAAE